ncbi:Gfo/Idh/MocA family oxidoreductase [Ktedonobacter racemifer]|uniref:Gfo/Idh/MocA family oxidoreductase n=1 Tax=Ktedonobacter racemifer TaxID=363277 RepID=UPI00146CE3AB
MAITGTRGRIEMDIVENVNHLQGNGEARMNASKGPFKSARIRVYPMFALPYDVEVPTGDGGHGGADPILLEQLFSPTPPADAFNRAASHIDGAASILVGIASNESMRTGKMVVVDDLFVLPDKTADERDK